MGIEVYIPKNVQYLRAKIWEMVSTKGTKFNFDRYIARKIVLAQLEKSSGMISDWDLENRLDDIKVTQEEIYNPHYEVSFR